MESENHPFEEEQHLPNLHLWVPKVKFRGCILYPGVEDVTWMLSDVKKDTAPEAFGGFKNTSDTLEARR